MSSLNADLYNNINLKLGDTGYTSKTGFNFTNLYFYEKYYFNDVYVEQKLHWFMENRFIGTYISLVYLAVIYALVLFMRSRERYSLRVLLITWNIGLALFSIFGSLRMWPEMVHSLRTKGFEYSMCNSEHVYGVAGHWSYLFVLSKVPELFDTVFIVLRKQKLIFLHYYHHATILAYVWFFYPEASSSNRWFGSMNYAIHSIMYTYYALRAMRINLPKRLSVVITSLQILQMIMGLLICTYIWNKKQYDTAEKKCDTTYVNLIYSILMYLSYFVLFFNFFIQSYLNKRSKRQQQATCETAAPIYNKKQE